MPRPLRRISALLLILLLTTAQGASAQWRMTVHSLLRLNGNPAGASIQYRDGILWAGYHSLLRSTDSGTTWKNVTPFFDPTADWIVDIDFTSRTTGIVTTFAGAFLTKDGGTTWRDLTSAFQIPFNPGSSARLSQNGDTILLALSTPGSVFRSTDGGTTWTNSTIEQLGRLIEQHGTDHYFLASHATDVPESGGALYRSRDAGATWNSTGGTFDEDCYSFAFDSCAETIYVINEAAAKSFDTASRILVSQDGGASWQTSLLADQAYLSGSLALAKQTAYVGTVEHGILRSTDMGATWKNVQGPLSAQYDANNLAALSDNMVVAFDATGSIWVTLNSGGDSVTGLYEAPHLETTQLFDTTTVGPCGTRATYAFIAPYRGRACHAPTVVRTEVLGPDALAYATMSMSGHDLSVRDSILVAFAPHGARSYHATLRITLSDSTVWDVPLGGRGSDSEIVSLTSKQLHTDTIGGPVIVTLGVVGAHSDMSVLASFDTASLAYQAASGPGGALLATRRADGSVSLRIPAMTDTALDTIRYQCALDLYPDADSCVEIRFSLDTAVHDSTCRRVESGLATICASGDACAGPILARFMRTGVIAPIFRVTPDPVTDGRVRLSASAQVDRAEIIVRDALGRMLTRVVTPVGPTGTVLELPRELLAGAAYLTVTGAGHTEQLRVMVVR